MKKFIASLLLFALAGCAAQPRPLTISAPASAPARNVPIPPAPPKGEPPSFAGIDAARLRALAGAPVLTRKDGATEMWRYDAGSCRVFFFLTGAPAKVQHVETMPRSKDGAADPACLTALESSKRS